MRQYGGKISLSSAEFEQISRRSCKVAAVWLRLQICLNRRAESGSGSDGGYRHRTSIGQNKMYSCYKEPQSIGV